MGCYVLVRIQSRDKSSEAMFSFPKCSIQEALSLLSSPQINEPISIQYTSVLK